MHGRLLTTAVLAVLCIAIGSGASSGKAPLRFRPPPRENRCSCFFNLSRRAVNAASTGS